MVLYVYLQNQLCFNNQFSCSQWSQLSWSLQLHWFAIFNIVTGIEALSDLSKYSQTPYCSNSNAQVCMVPTSLCISCQNVSLVVISTPFLQCSQCSQHKHNPKSNNDLCSCVHAYVKWKCSAVSKIVNIVFHLVSLYQGCKELK